jgi:hypothetical protein
MRNRTLDPTDSRTTGRLLYALGTIVILMLLVNLGLRFSAVSIWDDAYFFGRYADNYRHTGHYSWNAGESPSYGLTSVAYGTWIYLVRVVFGGEPTWSLWISSLTWGCAALTTLWMLIRAQAPVERRQRKVTYALFWSMLGLNGLHLAVHFSSGMDTTFAMAWLAAYLYLFKRFEGSLSPGKSLAIGLLGGVAWFIRPDLLLFPFFLPLALAFFGKKVIQKRMAGYILLFTSFMVLLLMASGVQYLGGLFPLSFYVKSLHSYGDGISRAYNLEGLRQLGIFLLSNLPTLILLPIALWLGRKVADDGTALRFSRNDKALMIGLLLFLGFHAFLVTPIMGYHQRFLYPIWPAIVYLGCKSLGIVLEAAPTSGWPIMNWRWAKPLLALSLTLLLASSTWFNRPSNLRTTVARMDLQTAYHELGRNNWPFLPQMLYLGDSLRIASTELGILGAMASHNTIYDLSGLHDNETAQNGLNTDRLLDQQRPDLIYMPHPDYVEMIAAIRDHPSFKADYLEYRSDSLDTWLGVAIRRDSKFFIQMRDMILQGKNVDE